MLIREQFTYKLIFVREEDTNDATHDNATNANLVTSAVSEAERMDDAERTGTGTCCDDGLTSICDESTTYMSVCHTTAKCKVTFVQEHFVRDKERKSETKKDWPLASS